MCFELEFRKPGYNKGRLMNAEICHITMAFAQHLFWKTYSFPPCTCFSKTTIHMSSQQMKSRERQWLREYLKCYMSRFTARQNNGSQDLKKQRSVLVIHLLLAQQTRTGWTTTPTQPGGHLLECWPPHSTSLKSAPQLTSLLSQQELSCTMTPFLATITKGTADPGRTTKSISGEFCNSS